jgi:hypothetical protein
VHVAAGVTARFAPVNTTPGTLLTFGIAQAELPSWLKPSVKDGLTHAVPLTAGVGAARNTSSTKAMRELVPYSAWQAAFIVISPSVPATVPVVKPANFSGACAVWHDGKVSGRAHLQAGNIGGSGLAPEFAIAIWAIAVVVSELPPGVYPSAPRSLCKG